MSNYTLFTAKGCGSAMIEAIFALAQQPLDLHEVNYVEGQGIDDPLLLSHNVKGQVPTLICQNGKALTQSAAIALYLCEEFDNIKLIPPAHSENYACFLQNFIFLTGTLYSSFTYSDFPNRFVEGKAAQAQLKENNNELKEKYWQQLEAEYKSLGHSGPWFLGKDFSLLDIFISFMSFWTPRRNWLKNHCPELYKIAIKTDEIPEIKAVWERNI